MARLTVKGNEYTGWKSKVREAVSKCESLEDVAREFRAAFPGMFVYRGGNHVALHLTAQQPRFALVVDRWSRERNFDEQAESEKPASVDAGGTEEASHQAGV